MSLDLDSEDRNGVKGCNFFGKMRSLFGVALPVLIGFIITKTKCDDIIACGGFIKSEVEINFALIEVS